MGLLGLIGSILASSGCSTTSAGRLPGSLPRLLEEAATANAAHDLDRERAALRRAEAIGATNRDSAEVQRRLAVIEWKYEARFDEARARLLKATESVDPAKAWLSLARLEQARGRFDAAMTAVRKVLKNATSETETRDARIALGRAAVEESVTARLEGRHEVSRDLDEARQLLQLMVADEPGFLVPSRLLLRASLLLGEGDTALEAWRSYFHVTHERPGPNLVADAGRDLARLLDHWHGESSPTETWVELVDALARSRLFTEAALVGLSPSAPATVRENRDVRIAVTYALFLREARALTEEHYRLTLLGKEDRVEWQASLSSAMKPVMVPLDERNRETRLDGPPIDLNRLGRLDRRAVEMLNRQFGAYVSVGETAGYFDLHMGHRVFEETRTVEQYGRRAQLRFIALDNMVSNGFQSWAWESGAQHGGWNKPYGIYQVRPAYVGGGLRAWRRLTSDTERAEYLEKMEKESSVDEARAAEDPHAYLPGLTMRLEIQGQTRLLERLRLAGLEGGALRLAFLSSYDEAIQESSIFAHEGRHAIDDREGGLLAFTRNEEYTAKLSEVVFAPEPRLALGAIISADIGNGTPHGKANLAIMKGLVAWMAEHHAEIDGFDGQRPALPQLDLLTDDQLRDAFRSMDRLAESD